MEGWVAVTPDGNVIVMVSESAEPTGPSSCARGEINDVITCWTDKVTAIRGWNGNGDTANISGDRIHQSWGDHCGNSDYA